MGLDGWAAAAKVAATAEQPEVATCPGCGFDRKVNQTGTIRKHKAAKGDVLPCTGSGAPVGLARIPTRSQRGYYRDRETGEQLPAVTSLLNKGMSKEAISFWSAKVVAETAMDNVGEMLRASRTPEDREEFIKWLKQEPLRRRDDRGDIGRAVHRLIEAHILSEPAPAHIAANPEFRPYLAHFAECVEVWQLNFIASEMVVAHYEDEYAGTLDYLFRSPLVAAVVGLPADTIFAGDTKTGGELDRITFSGHRHGVYPSAGAQMAAYRAAPWGWLRDGTKIRLPERAPIGVIMHLRPEGWRLYPARCGDDMYATFRHAKAMAEFETRHSKNVIGEALTLPDPTTSATTSRKAVA
ncbi:hypothetical protein FAF44_02765 [Nonomuraea sp. MG754425]|nr:hypothetical protein [Nonomuraea sp. MG754425]